MKYGTTTVTVNGRTRISLICASMEACFIFSSEESIMLFLIMLSQNIPGKIVGEIANYGVHVIRVVLRVVVFDQQHWTLNSVIMTDTRFQTSGPGKGKIVHSCAGNFGHQLF